MTNPYPQLEQREQVLFNPLIELHQQTPINLRELGQHFWRCYQRCIEASAQGYQFSHIDLGGSVMVTR